MALLLFALGANAAPLAPMRTSSALLADLRAQVIRLGTEFEGGGGGSTSFDNGYRSTVFSVKLKKEKLFLRAEYDEDSVLTHLGVALCDSSLFRSENIIAKFLERELLSLFLQTNSDASLKLKADNVSFTYNHAEILTPTIASLRPFLSLRSSTRAFRLLKDPKRSVAQWVDSTNNIFEIAFPLRYDLLAGMDKKESDELTETELRKYSQHEASFHAYGDNDTSAMLKSDRSIYLRKGKEYQRGLSTDCYFQKENNKYSFVFDAAYPQETVRSMFFMPCGKDTAVNLIVTQFEYGNKKEEYPVSLSALKSYLADYTPYVGMENSSSDTISTTILFVHKEFNNAFLVFFSFSAASISAILRQGLPIHASLISNIRTDNVENLFGHYHEGSKKIDVKRK